MDIWICLTQNFNSNRVCFKRVQLYYHKTSCFNSRERDILNSKYKLARCRFAHINWKYIFFVQACRRSPFRTKFSEERRIYNHVVLSRITSWGLPDISSSVNCRDHFWGQQHSSNNLKKSLIQYHDTRYTWRGFCKEEIQRERKKKKQLNEMER